MDERRFDEFTKRLSAGNLSRRAILKGAGAAFAGFAGAFLAERGAIEAARLRQPGELCRKAGDCASGVCGPADANGRQRCLCVRPGDCPAATGSCRVTTCVAGVCGTTVTIGAPCNDGNKCTADDTCQPDGRCAGTPIVCPKPDQCHQPGVCNPATGTCDYPSMPDGIPCNVENVCAKAAICQQGICVGGTPIDCDDGDPCTVDYCDDKLGACVHVPICDDGNPCTDDICSPDGTCTHQPSPVGKPCAASGFIGVCDGAGACVQCLTAQDCPGQDSECLTRVCNAGICFYSYAPAGTQTSIQIPGDCRVMVCDGAGNIIEFVDNTDIPIDGNPCTTDICGNGVPSNPPLPAGVDCGSGAVCDGAGRCVAASCIDGMMNGTETDVDCGGADCSPCAIGKACLIDSDCQSGYCAGGICACPTGMTFCPGFGCVDTGTDPYNCGFCGHVCSSGQSCIGGTCSGGGCPPLYTQCPNGCFPLYKDTNNCGQCGNVCAPGQNCVEGVCK